MMTPSPPQQRNVDWTVAFELAARAGPRELIRALTAALEHERAVFTEKYDALFAQQRAECDTILAQQRAGCDAILARQRAEYHANLAQQRADYDADLARQRAEFEQRFAALKRELLAKIENELGPLRRELAAANAELVRLRAAPASEPARVLH